MINLVHNGQNSRKNCLTCYIRDMKFLFLFVKYATVISKGTHWSVMVFFPKEAAFDRVETALNVNKKAS